MTRRSRRKSRLKSWATHCLRNSRIDWRTDLFSKQFFRLCVRDGLVVWFMPGSFLCAVPHCTLVKLLVGIGKKVCKLFRLAFFLFPLTVHWWIFPQIVQGNWKFYKFTLCNRFLLLLTSRIISPSFPANEKKLTDCWKSVSSFVFYSMDNSRMLSICCHLTAWQPICPVF